MLVIESWVINDDSAVPVSSDMVLEAVQSRIDSGRLETWLTSSSGRSLAFVTNSERAMVMLLEEEGDPGEHAVGPRGSVVERRPALLRAGRHRPRQPQGTGQHDPPLHHLAEQALL